MASRLIAALAAALLAGGTAAHAADKPGAQPRAASQEDRIAAEFAVFAGSPDNARSLVAGLRHGGGVTLAAPAGGGLEDAAFTPPTRPMGNGDVRIALALAQEQLIRIGVAHPAPGQIKAALVGGTVAGPGTGAAAGLQGVLQMRARGASWERIAGAMGTRVGHVMGGLQQTNRQLATGKPVPGMGAASGMSAGGGGGGPTDEKGQARP